MAVAAALFASFAAGAWITAMQSAHMVRAELSAALQTGAQAASSTLQDLGPTPDRKALRRLIAGFDGSRHVRAELVVDGMTAQHSEPASSKVVPPGWFTSLATPVVAPVSIRVPGAELRLVPVPRNEIAERWSEARRLIGLLLLSSLLSALFCLATTAVSLRRLRPLAAALQRLEQGRRGDPLAETGPPEIAGLAASFNRMQSALARAAAENRRLSAQLERLADEERAEVARDLHDEVGPLLFALTAWATAAEMQQRSGDQDAASTSLQSLHGAAEALQSAVRDMLRRLRDSAPAPLRLAGAVDGLMEFWRGVRPQTVFSADIADELEAVAEPVRAALFRVAQEGVSNAVRHGQPGRVSVAAALRADGAVLSVQDDGTADPVPGTGLGLVGLEERLQALGGTLGIDPGEVRPGEIRPGAGWRITGSVPAEGVRQQAGAR